MRASTTLSSLPLLWSAVYVAEVFAQAREPKRFFKLAVNKGPGRPSISLAQEPAHLCV